MGRGVNVVFQHTVHFVRCFGGVSLGGGVVAVVEDDRAVLIGDVIVGVGSEVLTAVADVFHRRRHLADVDAAFHTAEGQRTDHVGVVLGKMLKAEVGDRLIKGVLCADQLHGLDCRGVR